MENTNLFNTNFGYVWEAISDLSRRVNELEAERESTIDAFEDGFAAGEKRAISEADFKAAITKAPIKSVIEVSAPKEMINIIEEYHYKNGEKFKKVFIELPDDTAPELDRSGYAIGKKGFHNGVHCGWSYTKEEAEHNERLDAIRYANAPEIGKITKWFCGIKDKPGYKWVEAGLGIKRVKILEAE